MRNSAPLEPLDHVESSQMKTRNFVIPKISKHAVFHSTHLPNDHHSISPKTSIKSKAFFDTKVKFCTFKGG